MEQELTRTVQASDKLSAPINRVWEAIRPFGSWAKWCPIFEYMKIIGDGKDEEGAIREFKGLGSGAVFQERLRKRDDGKFYIAFDNVSITPKVPYIAWITTTVRLTRIDDQTTQINYSHTTSMEEENEEVRSKIETIQKTSMQHIFKALKEYLKTSNYLEITLNTLYTRLIQIKRDLFVANQSNIWDYDDYDAEIGPMPKMVKGLPATEALTPRNLGKMVERIAQVLYHKVRFSDKPLDQVFLDITKIQKDKDLEFLSQHLVKTYNTDEEFCQQLLQGVNPMCIAVVNSIDQVPVPMRSLKGQGKTVEELISEKRLFILDYKELRQLKLHLDMFFYAPVMLVYKEILSETESRLNVLGIQLSLDSDKVYTPNMEHKYRYQFARMFVALADHQVHEFKWHLGIAHLVNEAFSVSVHNCLSEGTPIRKLLEPHFEDTIAINFVARHTLIAKEYPFTNLTFAIGTKQALKVVSDAWKEWDFFKSSFPEQLKARGFDEKRSDGLDNYYYRDDGFLLWNAIGEYTKEFVEHIYKTDQAVAENEDLQKWADELCNKAKVNGFPQKIETKELLAHVLQIIIWNTTALHSALDFPQWTYLGFVPNRPNAIYKDMPPEDGNDITPQYIKEALPTEYLVLFQVLFSWLLSTPHDNNLSDIISLESACPPATEKFHRLLTEVTQKIEDRNQKLKEEGKAPYIFLLPKNVAMSVNI